MTAKTARPLPECRMCEIPTARATWKANGELCTACAAGIADTVRMLRPGAAELSAQRRQALLDRGQVVHGEPTVFVERFTPPVPGHVAPAVDGEQLLPCLWCEHDDGTHEEWCLR